MKKILLRGIALVLLALALYAGICSGAILHRALTQPYMTAGSVRYAFMGYYIMAGAYGLLCLILLAGAIFLFVRTKRKRSGSGRTE